MKWLKTDDNTDNVEVEESGGSGGGNGTGRMFGKIGGGGAIVVIIISLLLGKNPLQMLGFVNNVLPDNSQAQQGTGHIGTITNVHADNDSTFTLHVFNSTNDIWQNIFSTQFHKVYTKPKLYLFYNHTTTGCGSASSVSGPFYCPADSKVYLDLAFFKQLSQEFQAPGDLAKAYVVAHEMGHHIQHLLGITDQLDAARSRLSEAAYNKLSVKLELQADFYAGLWAHYAEQEKIISLDDADINSALSAANAVGDDNLEKQAQGYAVPETFTHGTSAQRMYWFKKGYTTGDFSQGDTFHDPSLN
ncbi:metalloprotease [Arachidicoccus ginsenosidimutans]|uniref:KPN_02809 family neutral zinc metallopeptidase n=1 Tax=Arachidicoccus sp. BS20 TaxID=1850526 RepID=UPI0007F08A2F|nr:neutral zinc metallopeptidase [Arachidicoccus sp. BS20]ANI89455.1 metalloprotease [Arachidicoccus sp. BS20]